VVTARDGESDGAEDEHAGGADVDETGEAEDEETDPTAAPTGGKKIILHGPRLSTSDGASQSKKPTVGGKRWSDSESLYNWEAYWDAEGKLVHRELSCPDREQRHNQWLAANGYPGKVRTWDAMTLHTGELIKKGVTLDSLRAKVRGHG